MNRTARPATTDRRPRRALVGTLVAGALALSACSGGSGEAASSASSVPAEASYNAADVTFAQGMLPHHEQAVEMARMAPTRSTDPAVLDLARRIEAAQGPEIETLTGWLSDWDADADGDMDGGMDHSGAGGMMSEQDMAGLEDAAGVDFDRMWLEMMLEHHTGAVGMAQTEVDEGEDPDAVALAREIQASQSAEITEMEQLLQDLATG